MAIRTPRPSYSCWSRCPPAFAAIRLMLYFPRSVIHLPFIPPPPFRSQPLSLNMPHVLPPSLVDPSRLMHNVLWLSAESPLPNPIPLTPSASVCLFDQLVCHFLLAEIARLDLRSVRVLYFHRDKASPPQLTFASISTRESAGISSSGISYRFCLLAVFLSLYQRLPFSQAATTTLHDIHFDSPRQ